MAPSKPRIGVLLTSGKSESRKWELINVRRRAPERPWVAQGSHEFRIHRKTDKYRDGFVGIPADVSMGEYIRYKYGGKVEVDFIKPEEVTRERLKANDINFTIIYDLLESFHLDRKEKKNNYPRVLDALRNADNVFPNMEFQDFINSKLLYYNHLSQHGLPIAPTITMTKEQWDAQVSKRGSVDTVANDVLEEIKRKGFKEFLIKPVFGQERKGMAVFKMNKFMELSCMDRLTKYLCNTMEKYPGIVIQAFQKGFGDAESPEIRFYFVGREYQYATVMSITAFAEYVGACTVKEEGGPKPWGKYGDWCALPEAVGDAELKKMKRIAAKVVETIPNVNLKRGDKYVDLPRLMTRVDMGCLRNGVFDPWINEIEFVPSFFLEDHDWPIDAQLGEQMVKITKEYVKHPVGRSGGKKQLASRKKRFNPSQIAKVLSVPFSGKGKAASTCKRRVLKTHFHKGKAGLRSKPRR